MNGLVLVVAQEGPAALAKLREPSVMAKSVGQHQGQPNRRMGEDRAGP